MNHPSDSQLETDLIAFEGYFESLLKGSLFQELKQRGFRRLRKRGPGLSCYTEIDFNRIGTDSVDAFTIRYCFDVRAEVHAYLGTLPIKEHSTLNGYGQSVPPLEKINESWCSRKIMLWELCKTAGASRFPLANASQGQDWPLNPIAVELGSICTELVDALFLAEETWFKH